MDKKIINKCIFHFKEEINENVLCMTENEQNLIEKINNALEIFNNIKFNLTNRTALLEFWLKNFKNKLNNCFLYLLYPDNTAALTNCRILAENIIILNFLLTNKKYINSWFFWYSYQHNGAIITKEFHSRYQTWKDWFEAELLPLNTNIKKNVYGWAITSEEKRPTLASLAKNTNYDFIYNNFFKPTSFDVHSNTPWNAIDSRAEHHTYHIISQMVILMNECCTILKRYVDKTVYKQFKESYFKILDCLDTYCDEILKSVNSV